MNAIATRGATMRPPAKQRFPLHVLPAVLVVYSCMLPRELTIEIMEFAFPPQRLMLLVLLPFLVMQAARMQLRPSFVDFLMVFASFWIFLALYITESLDTAVVTGLSESYNLLLAYLTGRVTIRKSRDFQRFFLAVLPGLFVVAVILAAESISHQYLIRPPLGRLLNYYSEYYYEVRLGLMRGLGPFPHPILGGVFTASFLPIVWYLTEKPMHRILGFLAVGSFFFSLSSTGFLAFIVGFGLIMTAFAQRVTRLPVFPAVIGLAIFGMVFISIFSEGGLFSFIVRRLTFSSGSGFYRVAIWTHAGAEALNNPIFGIGLRTYTRPAWMISPSVDAHWLVLALRYGLAVCLAVLVAMISSAVMSLRGAWSPNEFDRRLAYAIGFSLIAVIFTGFSVYLWEGVMVWVTLLTGVGVTFGQNVARGIASAATANARRATRLRPRAA